MTVAAIAGTDVVSRVLRLAETTQGPHYAVFDADGCLWKPDCMELVINYVAATNENYVADFHRYYNLLESGQTREAYRLAPGMLSGMTEARVRALVREALDHEDRDIGTQTIDGRTVARGLALKQNVVDIMLNLQRANVAVWVVSASPEIVVCETMSYFGISTGGRVIGLRNILRDGMLTADLKEPLSIYDGKRACILKYIHPTIPPLLGVGDSGNDEVMLEYSHVQLVVDRGNSLAAKARERNWFIIQ